MCAACIEIELKKCLASAFKLHAERECVCAALCQGIIPEQIPTAKELPT